jgi:hypothetical protein
MKNQEAIQVAISKLSKEELEAIFPQLKEKTL